VILTLFIKTALQTIIPNPEHPGNPVIRINDVVPESSKFCQKFRQLLLTFEHEIASVCEIDPQDISSQES
jgi:hypothetical protein